MMEYPMILKLTQVTHDQEKNVKMYDMLAHVSTLQLIRRAPAAAAPANSVINSNIMVKETLEEIYAMTRPLYCVSQGNKPVEENNAIKS